MKSLVLHKKEDLRIQEQPKPTALAGQVLVKVAYGGICGSDLHYYFHGAVGAFAVREPFTLGHEVSGVVESIGDGVTKVKVGQSVAINPGRADGTCPACRAGRENLCEQMVFFGSASTMPHTQGAFAEYVAVAERQVVPLPAGFDLRAAALIEPLAVSLHAINRASALMGKSVLVTGAGTIGTLVMMVARLMGATAVTITDVMDERLERAKSAGADVTINVLNETVEEKFDVALECSGNPNALTTCFNAIKRGGEIVQVGSLPAGDVPLPVQLLMTREINLIGIFRFGTEFDMAVDYIVNQRLDVTPLITHQYPIDQAETAFEMASNGAASTKVQIEF